MVVNLGDGVEREVSCWCCRLDCFAIGAAHPSGNADQAKERARRCYILRMMVVRLMWKFGWVGWSGDGADTKASGARVGGGTGGLLDGWPGVRVPLWKIAEAQLRNMVREILPRRIKFYFTSRRWEFNFRAKTSKFDHLTPPGGCDLRAQSPGVVK